MGFNYRREFEKFKSDWEKQEKIMREQGMSEETISELYNFSYGQFKGDRNYFSKKCDFAPTDSVDEIQTAKKVKKGIVSQPLEFDECLDLLEQIENEKLAKALKLLKESDYELLCMAFIDGLSCKDIALKLGQTKSNISQKLTRIQNFLKNI